MHPQLRASPTQEDSRVLERFRRGRGDEGALESDIIKMDVGLSGVNPRALACCEERETDFVGELLCWLGQKSGIPPLTFKEGSVTRPTISAVGVAGVAEGEDDEDEDVFDKARDNTVSSENIPSPGPSSNPVHPSSQTVRTLSSSLPTLATPKLIPR